MTSVHPGVYPGGGQPIAAQPVAGVPPQSGAVGWSQTSQVPAGCPPGLEGLLNIDQLLVKQKVEVFEAITGYETNNKYEILNTLGQRLFMAVEDTCCCTRNCCGNTRPFDIKILDRNNREVIHLSRPLRCSSCFFPCCLQKVEVQAPLGNTIGYVRQGCHPCLPKYKLMDENDETILRIEGPCCQWNICGDVEFDVKSKDERFDVGRISKQWSGLVKELFTDTDNFGVTFPMDLDVKMKAVMLGAVFLIDFMYFENNKDSVRKEANMVL
ncbi:phospholipid scramblase 1-like [Haliotis asinina]|uniref:phospholipid scramblase 1-like n=1 Tax=Haliotis asinina TaxID=109174 RepID=UPI0035318A82